MPTLDWLKKEFAYGYDSGDVLSLIPNLTRFREERRIGGSYRRVFHAAVLPYLESGSIVLELGPGKGSWTKAILKHIPQGTLHTVDFQDVSLWLKPEKHAGKLVCHKVQENSFSQFPDSMFDFFWSMGVLCHNNQNHIADILTNSFSKMRPGSHAVHQYADWEKLEEYGWRQGNIPIKFKELPDEQIWWPRNTKAQMEKIAVAAGWSVLSTDLNLVRRDSIMLLRKPIS